MWPTRAVPLSRHLGHVTGEGRVSASGASGRPGGLGATAPARHVGAARDCGEPASGAEGLADIGTASGGRDGNVPANGQRSGGAGRFPWLRPSVPFSAPHQGRGRSGHREVVVAPCPSCTGFRLRGILRDLGILPAHARPLSPVGCGGCGRWQVRSHFQPAGLGVQFPRPAKTRKGTSVEDGWTGLRGIARDWVTAGSDRYLQLRRSDGLLRRGVPEVDGRAVYSPATASRLLPLGIWRRRAVLPRLQEY